MQLKKNHWLTHSKQKLKLHCHWGRIAVAKTWGCNCAANHQSGETEKERMWANPRIYEWRHNCNGGQCMYASYDAELESDEWLQWPGDLGMYKWGTKRKLHGFIHSFFFFCQVEIKVGKNWNVLTMLNRARYRNSELKKNNMRSEASRCRKAPKSVSSRGMIEHKWEVRHKVARIDICMASDQDARCPPTCPSSRPREKASGTESLARDDRTGANWAHIHTFYTGSDEQCGNVKKNSSRIFLTHTFSFMCWVTSKN